MNQKTFRCATSRSANAQRTLALTLLSTLLAVSWVVCPARLKLNAAPQTALQAITDRVTYNAGDQVWVRIVSPAQGDPTQARFTVRYAGDAKPVAEGLALGTADESSPGYRLLWKVPLDARTGRYEIGVADDAAQQVTPAIGSFVVHRQVMQIVSAEVAHPYFTYGDAIGCSVKMENLSARSLDGLQLEFSERYWPWIVQQRERVGTDITKLQTDVTLKPHQLTIINSSHCAIATKVDVKADAKGDAKVDQPAIKQYAAVVWDRDRKNVYAIGFTPLVFVNPPGVDAPRPYPPQFMYPSLKAVNTTNYRQFHSEPYGADAIQFETAHTMFAPGSEAKVRFSLVNPTDVTWRQVSVHARLLGPDGKEVANHTMMERADLNPHGPVLKQEVSFPLPQNASGIYHVGIQIADDAGLTVATNDLELGVNPLPKSVLLFCAHEDDDGTQMGFIRALMENQIPLPYGVFHQRRCRLLRPVLSTYLRSGRGTEFWIRSHAGSARGDGPLGRAGGKHYLSGIAGWWHGKNLV